MNSIRQSITDQARRARVVKAQRENPSGASLTELREANRDRERDLENLAKVQASRPLRPPGRRG